MAPLGLKLWENVFQMIPHISFCDTENNVFDFESGVFHIENIVFDVENVIFGIESVVFDVGNDVQMFFLLELCCNGLSVFLNAVVFAVSCSWCSIGIL